MSLKKSAAKKKTATKVVKKSAKTATPASLSKAKAAKPAAKKVKAQPKKAVKKPAKKIAPPAPVAVPAPKEKKVIANSDTKEHIEKAGAFKRVRKSSKKQVITLPPPPKIEIKLMTMEKKIAGEINGRVM